MAQAAELTTRATPRADPARPRQSRNFALARSRTGYAVFAAPYATNRRRTGRLLIAQSTWAAGGLCPRSAARRREPSGSAHQQHGGSHEGVVGCLACLPAPPNRPLLALRRWHGRLWYTRSWLPRSDQLNDTRSSPEVKRYSPKPVHPSLAWWEVDHTLGKPLNVDAAVRLTLS